jgi:hypothetical protein
VPSTTDQINRIIDDAIRQVPDEATRQQLREQLLKQADEQLRPVLIAWAESAKDTGDLSRHYSERATFYETRAIEFVNSALRTLTYLNGGGLVAIPAAVAMFHTDVAGVKVQLITAAIWFVVGLLLVIGAQIGAFSALTQRASGEYLAQQKKETLVEAARDNSNRIIRFFENLAALAARDQTRANWEGGWLLLTGFLFLASSVCFIVGCSFGARALLA